VTRWTRRPARRYDGPMRPGLPLLLLAACAAPAGADLALDDAPDTDSDGVADDACDGTWTASFTGLPAAPTSGTSWKAEDGATYLLGRYGQSTPGTPDVAFALDESGCLSLSPGVVAIDVTGTGCAGKRATVDVTDRCGPACTEVRVLDPDGQLASSKTVRSSAPERLELAPAVPFSTVVVGSLDALVCGVTVRRAALTEAMRPEDTAADF